MTRTQQFAYLISELVQRQFLPFRPRGREGAFAEGASRFAQDTLIIRLMRVR